MTNRQCAVASDRPLWTDDELAAGLRYLQYAADPGERDLTAARVALLHAADHLTSTTAPSPRQVPSPVGRWRRPILIAAAVVALVAGGLIVPILQSGGRQHVDPAAAAELNQAADAAARVAAGGGDATPVGQYRYINIDGWAAQLGAYSFLQQSRQQIWIPADWHSTWLERRSTTGQRKWIHGSEQDAVAAGQPKDNVASTEPDLKGPCAQYFTNLCTAAGSWQTPTQAWIAGLPTNAGDLYDRLSDDAQGRGQTHESEMLVEATDALRTGLLPASVRATVYRAMAHINGVEIGDTAANLDGRVGTAFIVASPALRDETIIDPTTGDFIGNRTTTLIDDPVGHVPAGTVIFYTAVHSEIVKTLGATHS